MAVSRDDLRQPREHLNFHGREHCVASIRVAEDIDPWRSVSLWPVGLHVSVHLPMFRVRTRPILRKTMSSTKHMRDQMGRLFLLAEAAYDRGDKELGEQ